jgi:hypothetical protein
MANANDDRWIKAVIRAIAPARFLAGTVPFCLLVLVAAASFAPSSSWGATVSGTTAGSGLATGVPASPATTSSGRQAEASTPDGRGYWLVAADGGIFTFGDAGYFGSTGGTRLNAPIVGMASTPDGRGYWLVAADGGIFTFGDAGFFGSEPSAGVAVTNIVGLTKSPDGGGYWIGGRDGRADAFGDAVTLGSRLGQPLDAPVVGFAAESTSSTSTGPLAVASPSLPIALTGASYSASLAASGGTGPYSWSIASGSLPAGLTLSSSGQITGIPNHASDATFTARVVDSTFPVPRSASGAVTVVVSAATPTSALSGELFSTTNWSGYVAGNGPFTSVSGTFSVASLDAGTPGNALLTEWVGIDGWGNSSLIQAGVTQYPDPSEPGTFRIQPWWTVLPKDGVAINISDMTVSAGDEVTINIAQVAGTQWDIQLVDDTNGQNFTTEQTYTGPGASAEWIAEAPVVGGRVAQLSPYNPAIRFTDLRNAPLNTTVQEVEMIQNGNPLPTSTPSALTPDGFNVAYGATAPPAP